jgi:hypothetical protein
MNTMFLYAQFRQDVPEKAKKSVKVSVIQSLDARLGMRRFDIPTGVHAPRTEKHGEEHPLSREQLFNVSGSEKWAQSFVSKYLPVEQLGCGPQDFLAADDFEEIVSQAPS